MSWVVGLDVRWLDASTRWCHQNGMCPQPASLLVRKPMIDGEEVWIPVCERHAPWIPYIGK